MSPTLACCVTRVPWASSGALSPKTNGRRMDKDALNAKFDGTLLTEAEFEKGPNAWMQFPDPFPQRAPSEPQAHEQA